MAPNSSRALKTSGGSSCETMPLTASRVSPLLASSTCPEGATTYGLSPACMTRASPSMLTIAWRSEGTRLIAKCTYRQLNDGSLVAPGSAQFVDSHELDELVALRLVRRDDALGPQVLQHPRVGVVGSADFRGGGQRLLEIGDGHLLIGDRS